VELVKKEATGRGTCRSIASINQIRRSLQSLLPQLMDGRHLQLRVSGASYKVEKVKY